MAKKKLRQQTLSIRNFIVAHIEDHPTEIVGLISKHYKISRQASHQHVSSLLKEGLLGASGKTTARKYFPVPQVQFREEFSLNKGNEEDVIWRTIVRPKLGKLTPQVEGICQYGFTEMANNAIDHSAGAQLTVSGEVTLSSISFVIGDNGIGIFNKLQKEFGLESPRHAILELCKGKVTTDPEHHSGEGIFFTSRMFDGFTIQSGPLGFVHLKSGNDYMITEDFTDIKMAGTLVKLEISPISERTTTSVFSQYSSGEDLGFTKTKIPVLLARHGNENLVSRSQAKRLLTRLDRFKEIWLDFEGVETIGQGFADEIFRVYARQNPDVKIEFLHETESIRAMINRVLTSEAN